MRPYSKEEITYDIVECPGCGNPSRGHFEDGECTMREYCPDCKKEFSQNSHEV